METKVFSAFGYAIIRNDVNASEDIFDDTLRHNEYKADEDFLTVWLQTSGKTTHLNASGEIQVRVAGDSTLSKPLMYGRNKLTFDEASTVFCVSPSANPGRNPPVPLLEHFALLPGASVTFKKGTRLFLADGNLRIGESNISGPRQIVVTSGDKSVSAITPCLGLLFV
jgi:hypothetical protein